jgi:hypothetical protein
MRAAVGVAAIGVVVALSAAGVGCVAPPEPVAPRGVAVNGPPPAPLAETRPPPPGPAAVWVAGYWHWTGMQYTWIPGHWDGEHPGATWTAPRYVSADGAYYYEGGAWTTGLAQPASTQAPPRVVNASALH